MELKIRLAYPPEELRPNSRPYFMKKATAVKKYRLAAAMLAKSEINKTDWGSAKERVVVDVEVRCPTKNLPDQDNAIAALKSAFDGLQDGGVVVNDRGLRIGEVTLVPGKRADACVMLTVKEILDADKK